MARYEVHAVEEQRVRRVYYVEAESEEEARAKVAQGEEYFDTDDVFLATLSQKIEKVLTVK